LIRSALHARPDSGATEELLALEVELLTLELIELLDELGAEEAAELTELDSELETELEDWAEELEDAPPPSTGSP